MTIQGGWDMPGMRPRPPHKDFPEWLSILTCALLGSVVSSAIVLSLAAWLQI